MIPLMGKVVDPTAAYTAYNQMLGTGADVARTQAQTGLIGQQAIGAGLTNQMTALRNAVATQAYAPMIGGGQAAAGQPGSLPWDNTPLGAAPAAALDAPGGSSAGPPRQAGATGTGAPVQSQALGASAAPAIGQQQQTADQGGAAPPPFVSPNGALYPGVGVPMPKMWAMGIANAMATGGDVSKAIQSTLDARRLAIGQLMSGAMGQNGQVDPGAWNQAVRTAFDQGFIDSNDAHRYYNNPGLAQSLITSLVPPGEQPSVRGAQAGAAAQAEVGPAIQRAGGEAQAKVGPELATAAGKQAIENANTIVTVQQRNPDNTYSQVQMTKGQAIARGLLPPDTPTGASLANPNAPMNGQQYAARVTAGENPGGNPAQANTSGPGGTPTSSAVGNGQFQDLTWLDQMQRYRPDLTQGKTDAQILAMRANPGLSAEIIQTYARDNAAALNKSNLPVNAATLGLSHSFGAGGAQSILRAPANTPLTSVFPPLPGGLPNPVIAANPTYANKTVADAVGGFVQRFGTGAVDLGPGGAAAAPAAAAGGAPGAGAGVISQGAPEPTKGQEAVMDYEGKTAIPRDQALVTDAQTGAMHAQSAIPVLLDARDKIPLVASGSFGQERTNIASFMATFGPDWANKFLAATTNIDPSKAADMQEFIKQTFQQVTSAESQMGGGVRVGALLTKYFSQAMPNINMQGTAIRDMMNFLLIGNQMTRDYAQGAAQHFNDSTAAWTANPVANRYTPLTSFDEKWTAPGALSAPNVYEAAALLTNGKPHAQWADGLTPQQQVAAIQIATRADPSVKFAPSQREAPAAPAAGGEQAAAQ